jgi:hypothetical protein
MPRPALSREGRGNREYGYPAAVLRGIIRSKVLFPKYNRHIIVLGGWLSIYILNDFHFQDRIFRYIKVLRGTDREILRISPVITNLISRNMVFTSSFPMFIHALVHFRACPTRSILFILNDTNRYYVVNTSHIIECCVIQPLTQLHYPLILFHVLPHSKLFYPTSNLYKILLKSAIGNDLHHILVNNFGE